MASWWSWTVVLMVAITAVNSSPLPDTSTLQTFEEVKNAFHPALYARSDDGVHCSTTGNLNAFDDILAQQAMAIMGQQCDNGGDSYVPAYSNGQPGKRSFQYLNMQVYVCNYWNKPNRCASDEIQRDLKAIMQQCHTQSGWTTHNAWGPKNYGINYAGEAFC